MPFEPNIQVRALSNLDLSAELDVDDGRDCQGMVELSRRVDIRVVVRGVEVLEDELRGVKAPTRTPATSPRCCTSRLADAAGSSRVIEGMFTSMWSRGSIASASCRSVR